MPEVALVPGFSAASALSGTRGQKAAELAGAGKPEGSRSGTTGTSGTSGAKNGDRLVLSPEAQRLVAELKATDARVRAHEAAHMAAAGGLAKGGPSFSYQRGPDGKAYAVGGEVSIDSGGVPGNPKAALAKARQIQQAALAPSDPSPQDRAVAAAAAAMAAQALAELSAQDSPKASDGKGQDPAAETQGRLLDISV